MNSTVWSTQWLIRQAWELGGGNIWTAGDWLLEIELVDEKKGEYRAYASGRQTPKDATGKPLWDQVTFTQRGPSLLRWAQPNRLRQWETSQSADYKNNITDHINATGCKTDDNCLRLEGVLNDKAHGARLVWVPDAVDGPKSDLLIVMVYPVGGAPAQDGTGQGNRH